MRKTTVLLLGWALVGSAWAQVSQKNVQGNATIDAFWERFRAAVTKNDKTVVASLSQFPIGMPYGISNIKNNAQLIRRYREVFNGEDECCEVLSPSTPQDQSRQSKRVYSCLQECGGHRSGNLFIRLHAQRLEV